MRIEIALAALGPGAEQRVRIAASLLGAHHYRARVRAWDGTRCALLVADGDDAYGRIALAQAGRRGVPALVLGGGAPDAPVGMAAHLAADAKSAEVMQAMLRLLPGGRLQRAGDGEREGPAPSALTLLCADRYRGQPVLASRHGRRICIRPQEGRVYAASLSDLVSARDSLLREDWTVQCIEPGDRQHLQYETRRSLDAFLLQAAMVDADRLEPFPAGSYRLLDWPDLGSAPEFVGALTVAGALLRSPSRPEQLVRECGVAIAEVHAALWAFRAANLLEAHAEPEPVRVAPRPAASGLLRRIAGRFGLALQ